MNSLVRDVESDSGAVALRSNPHAHARQIVERVDIDVLTFPLDPPFRASVRLIPTVDCVLCRVTTKDGVEGAGYSFAFGVEEAKALASLMRLLADRLISKDAIAGEAVWSALWSSLALLGQPGAGVSALAALDIALWDIRGKAFGAPLYRLLGAARETIPTYGSGGSLDAPIEQLAAEMAGYAAAGHGAVKMKLGGAGDTERVRAVRDAIGARTRLIVDATQQWSPKEALSAARQLEPFDIWWLEEPVPAPRIDWCAEVRAGSRIRIASGETNFTMDDFRRLLDARAVDILMPNLQRVGGITPWLKVAAAAAIQGIPIASHVSAEINAHLLCAIPNGLVLECVPWWPKFYQQTLDMREGVARPPDRPGLGFDIDPDIVARRRVR